MTRNLLRPPRAVISAVRRAECFAPRFLTGPPSPPQLASATQVGSRRSRGRARIRGAAQPSFESPGAATKLSGRTIAIRWPVARVSRRSISTPVTTWATKTRRPTAKADLRDNAVLSRGPVLIVTLAHHLRRLRQIAISYKVSRRQLTPLVTKRRGGRWPKGSLNQEVECAYSGFIGRLFRQLILGALFATRSAYGAYWRGRSHRARNDR